MFCRLCKFVHRRRLKVGLKRVEDDRKGVEAYKAELAEKDIPSAIGMAVSNDEMVARTQAADEARAARAGEEARLVKPLHGNSTAKTSTARRLKSGKKRRTNIRSRNWSGQMSSAPLLSSTKKAGSIKFMFSWRWIRQSLLSQCRNPLKKIRNSCSAPKVPICRNA